MAVNPYTNLYFKTDELVKKFKPALTNTFDVFVAGEFGGVSNSTINFLAYDAVLPGTSYELGQVYGDRMGRTEQYPTKRVYPPVDVSFYVDQNYDVINYFEAWMNSVSVNVGSVSNSYVRHNYASSYEREVIITKFERQFRQKDQRLVKEGVYGPPAKSVTYTLRNAFPSNLISIPVSYDGASILKTTVTFNYDVYNYQSNRFALGTDPGVEENGSPSGTVIGPGGNAPAAPTGTAGASEAEFPDGYPQLPSLQQQIDELREMRLRSQNRSGSPVTPALQGPPAPTN